VATYYLSMEEVILLHAQAMEKSGDPPYALIKDGILRGVVLNIQNDDWYPTLEEKVAHLFHSLACFHCFENGNKRTAVTASAQMLLKNGVIPSLAPFMTEMENIVEHVAGGLIEKDLLKDIIVDYVNGDDDEAVKLRVLEAIQYGAPPADVVPEDIPDEEIPEEEE
jgi:death-on-curing protein